MNYVSAASQWAIVLLSLCVCSAPAYAKQVNLEVEMITVEHQDQETAVADDVLRMQVRLKGEGRPLVLVGGGLTGWNSWQPHAERLAERRRVALLQPLNVQFGLENRPLPEGYGAEMESAALKAALDDLGWRGPVDLVAWSYGALISLDFALDHPERIRTLTLIEPPAVWVLPDGHVDDPSLRVLKALDLVDDVTESDLEEILPAMGLVPAGMRPRDLPQWPVWSEHRRSLLALLAPLEHEDDPARLSGFDRPVYLVTGVGTATYYVQIQQRLAELLPDVRSSEMPAVHAPHIVSVDRFLDELEQFQEGVDAPDVRYVTSRDGTSIGYLKRGAGKPVVFVHGTTADHRSALSIAPHLEDAVTIYSMDRRGRGWSGDAPEYDFLREAEDVAAVAESIGEPVTLFGHSYGGLVALEAALLTSSVEALILYEPALPTGDPMLPASAVERVQELVDQGRLEEAMELVLRDVAKIPEHELEAYRQTPLWDIRIPIASTIPRELAVDYSYTFQPERFADLEIPTLLLLGGDSPDVYRDAIETLAATLPNNEVSVLAGQQHMAHHRDPARVAEEVQRFVTVRSTASQVGRE